MVMPKSILAIVTILSVLAAGNLTGAATETQNRCRLAPSTSNLVAKTGKKCGLKRMYVRPRYRR
jgi:hypothetical protein